MDQYFDLTSGETTVVNDLSNYQVLTSLFDYDSSYNHPTVTLAGDCSSYTAPTVSVGSVSLADLLRQARQVRITTDFPEGTYGHLTGDTADNCITVGVKDEFGNTADIGMLRVTVDKTPPAITGTIVGNAITLESTDSNPTPDTNRNLLAYRIKENSGCDEAELSRGGGNRYSAPFDLTNPFHADDGHLCVRSEDKVYNSAHKEIDLNFTVEGDSDGDSTERFKDIRIFFRGYSGATDTKWGTVDTAAECTSSASFPNTFTFDGSGNAGARLNKESDNGKHVCVTVVKNDITYYRASPEVGGINSTPPVPGTPDLSNSDDTGSSNRDNITNKTTDLTITVTGANDSIVALYNGGTAISGATGTVVNGTVSIDIDLAEGTHTITAKARYGSSDESSASSALTITVDTTDPTIGTISLAGDVANGYLNNAEKGNNTGLLTAPTSTDTNNIRRTSYAVITSSQTCGSTHSFSTTIPRSNTVTGADGEYAVCVKVEDTAGNDAFKKSSSFTKDTIDPVLGTISLAGDAADGYINRAERSNTNDLITEPTVTDTNATSLSYAVVDSDRCHAGLSFLSAIPHTDDTSTDKEYYVCVKAADAAGNNAFETSPPFIKDTSVPTLDIAVTITGEKTHSGVDYLNAGDTMTVTVTANEDTKAGSITAVLGGLTTNRNITLTKSNTTTYTGTYTIQER